MTICDVNGRRTDKAFISITHSDEKPGDPPRPCLLPEPFRQSCRGRHQHGARAPHDPRFPRFGLHPVAFPFLRRLRLLRLRFLLPDALRNRPARLFLFQHSLPLMRKLPFPGAIRLHSHFPDEHRHDAEHIAAHPDFEAGERGHGLPHRFRDLAKFKGVVVERVARRIHHCGRNLHFTHHGVIKP